MSYLSTSENVGFSGIPQTIPDASCATQYKMAVEGVPGGCGGEVNMFIHDSSGDEQTYIPHLSDNYFHTKFKIDPNELYTFHDSDVIASEITVSHTEDNYIFPETIGTKSKDLDVLSGITNGEVHDIIKKEVVTNGHYPPNLKSNITVNHKEIKTINAKVQKIKSQGQQKEISRTNGSEVKRPSVHSPKGQNNAMVVQSQSSKVSINSANTNNVKAAPVTKSLSGSETFLDVFKREQGLVENQAAVPSVEKIPIPIKVAAAAPKKLPQSKPSQSKPRRGRGPTVHEALQRIPNQRRAIALPISTWHAPGEEIFRCGPLTEKQANAFRQLDNSSSDDDNMPDFESAAGPVCVEESAAESRGARLALRRAAMRRQVARAATTLDLADDLKEYLSLTKLIKKQINSPGSTSRLPPQTVNHLLALRGMPTLLTIQERRRLRESGWSGGESTRSIDVGASSMCAEEKCTDTPLPCARFCLKHMTLTPEQRLYAPCAAVFAGGQRCKQPLLPLQEQTPLCAEHAWKRDNYEQLSRECKPQKAARKRAWVPQRPPRRPKRRRRLVPRRAPAHPHAHAHAHSLSEINVCSNSSTYDSSEDAAVGALSESEYVATSNPNDLEVGQVPPDDILDPSVLSQMPDEAFTEFFNQAEGGPAFAESSELAAALEAVLDERALDTIADCVFTQTPQAAHAAHAPHAAHAAHSAHAAHAVHAPHTAHATHAAHTQAAHVTVAKTKMQVPAPVSVEMSSSAPS